MAVKTKRRQCSSCKTNTLCKIVAFAREDETFYNPALSNNVDMVWLCTVCIDILQEAG